MSQETDPLDAPDDFDELMERLPWSLRTRILNALRGDDEDEEWERPMTEEEIRATLPPLEPWADPTVDEILKELDRLG